MKITSLESIECTKCLIAGDLDWRFEVHFSFWHEDKRYTTDGVYLVLDPQIEVANQIMDSGLEKAEWGAYALYQLDSYMLGQLIGSAIGYYEIDDSGTERHENLKRYSGETERAIREELNKTVQSLRPADPNDEFDPIVLQQRIAELEAQIRKLKGLS